MTIYGPNNPHPLSRMKTELVWEGKYDEFGNRREVNLSALSMPLQRIETIDDPQSRAEEQGSLFDSAKEHRDDYRNCLIWGDNKLALASLLESFRGAVDLVYIDPPFDVGADFKVDIAIGDEAEGFTKEQSIMEMVAYRDIWGKGSNSYIQMLYERLVILRDLLSETGSIFVHCDWRVNSLVRAVMDEVFGREAFVNEVVWKRAQTVKGNIGQGTQAWGANLDTIYFYRKSSEATFNHVYTPYSDDYITKFYKYVEPDGRRYRLISMIGPGGAAKGNPRYEVMGVTRYWRYSQDRMKKMIAGGLIVQTSPGTVPQRKLYLNEDSGVPLQTLWDDIGGISAGSAERVDYPTQKPEALLERIIRSCTDEDDLVLDAFCGSGTTLAVAEKLGRRWIGCDLGRFAVHTTRKRMIGVQRELHEAEKPYRSFDVYNLGRYERQWWQKESLKGADDEHRAIVLKFFKAEPLTKAPSPLLHARKGPAFVHVDGIDSIFTRNEVKELAHAVAAAGGKEAYVLAWDFEMDIRQVAAAVEAETGVKLRLARIPREIMEKNRTEVPPFFEVAVLEVAPVIRKEGNKRKVDIKLGNFLPSLSEVPSKELEALQERAIESGFDFIDFWAVDFDWKPNRPFNHHWQDFRTRKDRTLKTVSDAEHVYSKAGTYTACIKVVDVFGCDTSITVEVAV